MEIIKQTDETNDQIVVALENWKKYLIGETVATDDDLYYLVRAQDDLVSNEGETGYFDTIILDGDVLYNDLDMTNSASLTKIATRLKAMAISLSTTTSKYYGNPELLNAIIYGINFFSTNYYNPNIDRYGNWWDWEIGVTLPLDDTIILVQSDLGSDVINDLLLTIDKHVPDASIGADGKPSTGANLLDRALAKTLRYIIDNDFEAAKNTAKKIDIVFSYVNSQDGFYKDGGYIQHTTLPYTATYGGVLLGDVLKFKVLATQTDLIAEDSTISSINELLENNFMPFLYDSQMLFSTRGRSVARSSTGNSDAKEIMIDAYIIAILGDDKEFAKSVCEIVKYHIENNTIIPDYYSNIGLYRAQYLQSLLNDNSFVAHDNKHSSKYYNSVDLLNFFGEKYLVNLSLYSTRIASTEIGNGENKTGNMQRAGSIFIYNGDQSQFDSAMVATINPFNYPGTTTDYYNTIHSGDADWGGQLNMSNWAGGITAENSASASLVQDLTGVTGSDLTATKSWFFFKDQFVSIASDIKGSADAIDTTVFNTKLVDNQAKVKINTELHNEFEGQVEHVFVDNQTNELGIGYYFFEPTQATFKKEDRTGDYSTIEKGREGKVTKTYSTLLLDNKVTDNYAFSSLVNIDSETFETYVDEPNVQILSQDENSHSVYHKVQDTYMLNCFKSGVYNGISVDFPICIIIENARTKSPTIYISDPTEQLDSVSLIFEDYQFEDITTDEYFVVSNKVSFNLQQQNGETKAASLEVTNW